MAKQSNSDLADRAMREHVRKSEARIVVTNLVRWCNNMLTEVQAQHSEYLSETDRELLREVVSTVGHASTKIKRK